MIQLDRHVAYKVGEASQVGHARRAASQAAEALGLDEVATGKVAVVVTELGTNLLKHAREGRLWIAPMRGADGVPFIEVLSVDAGPGIADVDACMSDGYSTSGTCGNGLGAVRRLSDEFDLLSVPGQGTVILARVRRSAAPGQVPRAALTKPAGFIVGAVALAMEGEHVSGDAWRLSVDGDRAALAVVDGLGHGPHAAEAARCVLTEFERGAFRGPSALLDAMHQAARGSRGAAVAVAEIDGAARSVCFSGVGNVSARMVSGTVDRSLASQHGTVGLQMRQPRDERHEWPAHALVVFHSDGLTGRWHIDAQAAPLLRRHPSVVAAWLARDHARGRDDVTVVVIKWEAAA